MGCDVMLLEMSREGSRIWLQWHRHLFGGIEFAKIGRSHAGWGGLEKRDWRVCRLLARMRHAAGWGKAGAAGPGTSQ